MSDPAIQPKKREWPSPQRLVVWSIYMFIIAFLVKSTIDLFMK